VWRHVTEPAQSHTYASTWMQCNSSVFSECDIIKSDPCDVLEWMSVCVCVRLSVTNGSSALKSTKELDHVRRSYDFLNNSWAGPFALSLSLSLSLSSILSQKCHVTTALAPVPISVSRASPQHTHTHTHISWNQLTSVRLGKRSVVGQIICVSAVTWQLMTNNLQTWPRARAETRLQSCEREGMRTHTHRDATTIDFVGMIIVWGIITVSRLLCIH